MAIEQITIPVARKFANLTQKQLANACGVSESTIINWEKGRSEPTVTQAMRLAAACGLNCDDINFLPQSAV